MNSSTHDAHTHKVQAVVPSYRADDFHRSQLISHDMLHLIRTAYGPDSPYHAFLIAQFFTGQLQGVQDSNDIVHP